MASRELTAADVDIWLVPRPLLLRDPLLLARYEALLARGERERLARIVHEETRHEYLVARALVRTTLSRYDAAVAPAAWRFDVNEYGRPAVAAGQTALDLRFNLSHAHGLIACAVTLGRAVGIDVEWNRRGGASLLDSIEHFFSPSEVRSTMALPSAERLVRFFQVWTLKESYIKAHGKGLSIPLADFSFHFDGGAVRLSPCTGDRAERWRSWVWAPDDEHTLALTAEFAPGEEVRMQIETVTP